MNINQSTPIIFYVSMISIQNDLSAVKGLLDDDTLETLTMNDDKNLIYTPEAGLLLSIPEVRANDKTNV